MIYFTSKHHRIPISSNSWICIKIMFVAMVFPNANFPSFNYILIILWIMVPKTGFILGPSVGITKIWAGRNLYSQQALGLFSGENWEIPTGLIFCCFNQLVVQSEWIGTFKVRKSNSLSSFSYVNGIYNGYFGVYPTSCCLHLASGQSVEESQYQAWRAASSDFLLTGAFLWPGEWIINSYGLEHS